MVPTARGLPPAGFAGADKAFRPNAAGMRQLGHVSDITLSLDANPLFEGKASAMRIPLGRNRYGVPQQGAKVPSLRRKRGLPGREGASALVGAPMTRPVPHGAIEGRRAIRNVTFLNTTSRRAPARPVPSPTDPSTGPLHPPAGGESSCLRSDDGGSGRHFRRLARSLYVCGGRP
ncbi:hypothetical protein AHIS1636_09520 [Arthrobacter mangrovi]|uniref:Uncharacterized protein n=1 Tax=Arthrobacter mangrovi TaxID=2966350 RepID=A0ABQ5MR89_9MICC|nr:hypothetical protein AHIS1636_09520 [Arthrobacter mangrovi]